ncbi:hypothetical protein GOP47_0019535 [Adiantum capillus-veneris]|uniref:40S ribosomal protein S8 n=1 Tax=Adiantum capillus-veneris TaxID=13818 RepID=A0A9D4Z8K1_ADICA|nr:hypothetical protein GOP47_0019535 [Adiantum capillus-veneris]
MGISRDSTYKRRATGGKKKTWRKKRKYELGRQPGMSKLSNNKTVRKIRMRGGNFKFRALRLDTGNYSWGSEATTRKTRILDIVDAAPFRQWYSQHYGVELGKKKRATSAKKEAEDTDATAGDGKKRQSKHVERKISARNEDCKLDAHLEDQIASGCLLACISSRPGQCGRADGYTLEGKKLEFYQKKIQRKKGKGTGAAA